VSTLMAQSPRLLHLVTYIAQMVSQGDHRSTHSRHGGSIGTNKTFLVAPTAQRGPGKHRAVSA
jgi:hypothetical protein